MHIENLYEFDRTILLKLAPFLTVTQLMQQSKKEDGVFNYIILYF